MNSTSILTSEAATYEDVFDSWVVEEAAKTYSADYNGSVADDNPIYSPSQTRILLDKMFRKDEVISSSITTKADAIVASGLYFDGSNQRNVDRAKRLVSKRFVRQIANNLNLYGNAFAEIERTPTGTPVAFHVIETHTVIPHDPEGHGEPTYYAQRINGEEVILKADDIFHFRLERVSTGQWAEIPVQPVAQYVALKLFIKNHVTHLFRENLFRPVINIEKGVSKDELKEIITHLKEARKDPKKPLVNFGDGSTAPYMEFTDSGNYKAWIDKADSAILTQMQVPPIMAAMPDNSGRSSGEQETYKAFNTHIKGITGMLEEEFASLFEKAGLTGVELYFGSPDKKTQKDILEMAVQFKAMGAKPDKLTEWIKKEGIDLPSDFFNEDAFMVETQQDRNAISNPTNVSSRMSEGKSEGEMNERTGTGSDGETREDQLISEALDKYQIHSIPGFESRVRAVQERFS